MLNSASNWRTVRTWGTRSLNPWTRWARFQVEELEPRLVLSGIWTQLTHDAPDPLGIQTIKLLPDGTIMANGGSDSASKDWYRLTPDSAGNYANGTWTTLAPMGLERLFYASNVLQNNDVFVYGGEYSGPATTKNFVNSGEIYNPLTNVWTPVASIPASLNPSNVFGDDPTEVLQNGTILAGYIAGPQTFIYHPTTNTWSAGGTKLSNDQSDEESWAKLPGGDILSYNVFGNPQTAQRYDQTTNSWIFSGAVPVTLETTASELGGALMLPDGRLFQIGGTPNNALYTPSGTTAGAGTWTAAPVTPGGLGGNDAPAAVEPNGMVLMFVGETPGFGTSTSVFEYDPVANTITPVTLPPALATALGNQVQFNTTLLDLPNGQILMSDATDQLWVYTPVGGPQNSWRPTISNIANNGNGTFTLTGTQINGLDEGSNYGDDRENATNYPIVRVTDATGKVFYARTFNWSSTGVATGNALETTQFVLPSGVNTSSLSIVVIANGIPSLPFTSSGLTTYYPLRYLYNPITHLYSGNLTLVNNGLFAASGTITIFFPSLPKGVTLANATGKTAAGVPFIKLTGTVAPHGAPLRVQIDLANPLRQFLSTFFIGFPIQILVQP
jgi:Kelch motif